MLSSFLDSLKDEKKASLAVADAKLANSINKISGLSLNLVSDSTTTDLYRAIREHLPSLITGLTPKDIDTMNLGLSHSLSRHKLKFSPDKVDTMIIQAIALLDDLDKELNQYAMRVKEWYGWHFPEMARIINDNVAYARVVLTMGMRSNASKTDLTDVLPEEIEGAVKAAAEVSMGTEITPDDLENIQALAEQVVDFTEYRQQLSSYLSNRMKAIAPNLTALVGDLVGARLIAHAGSLTNLSKSPASTIQILGAEKALFRALKTKHDTPKYGLIYHASLVGQATGKNKGKIARVLAAKAALGLRVDSLSTWGADQEHETTEEPTEEERSALGVSARRYVENRLRAIENRPIKFDRSNTGIAPPHAQAGKWEIKEARKYNKNADGLKGDEPAAAALPEPSSAKKEKKPLIQEVNGAADDSEEEDDSDDEETEAVPTSNGVNGKKLSEKEEKALRKAEKAARKAARAEKRRLKEEKRAKKEAKLTGTDKKRKRESDVAEIVKEKKKKKSKSS
jgi:nucleolar protein 58